MTAVKMTAARVPSVGVATQSMLTTTTAITAVNLIAHCGKASEETSEPVVCQNSLFRYSANIRLMTAFPPGLRAEIAVHAKRYDTRGP